METCPRELFDTCLVPLPAESYNFGISSVVPFSLCIGLVLALVSERYPICFTILQLWFITSFTLMYQSIPKYAGSRVFELLHASAAVMIIAASYICEHLRGTHFFAKKVVYGARVVAVYLLGVVVHFFCTASPDSTFFTSMDQHLVGTSCLVWEYGWFYAVAVAQVTLTFFVAARKVVLSSSDLQQMRTTELNDYRTQLLKSGVFTAGMVGLQGLSLYFSTRSATEIGTSISVVLALLGRLGV
jgi:hypothetical protein